MGFYTQRNMSNEIKVWREARDVVKHDIICMVNWDRAQERDELLQSALPLPGAAAAAAAAPAPAPQAPVRKVARGSSPRASRTARAPSRPRRRRLSPRRLAANRSS